jgi:hypothetical protein
MASDFNVSIGGVNDRIQSHRGDHPCGIVGGIGQQAAIIAAGCANRPQSGLPGAQVVVGHNRAIGIAGYWKRDETGFNETIEKGLA